MTSKFLYVFLQVDSTSKTWIGVVSSIFQFSGFGKLVSVIENSVDGTENFKIKSGLTNNHQNGSETASIENESESNENETDIDQSETTPKEDQTK